MVLKGKDHSLCESSLGHSRISILTYLVIYKFEISWSKDNLFLHLSLENYRLITSEAPPNWVSNPNFTISSKSRDKNCRMNLKHNMNGLENFLILPINYLGYEEDLLLLPHIHRTHTHTHTQETINNSRVSISQWIEHLRGFVVCQMYNLQQDYTFDCNLHRCSFLPQDIGLLHKVLWFHKFALHYCELLPGSTRP